MQSGEYFAIFSAPPCSTFSVSRFFRSSQSADGGPPPVRDRENIRGIPGIPSGHVGELNDANAIVDRTVALLEAAHRSGAETVMEHPADRGDPAQPSSFMHARHGPVWLMPEVRRLLDLVGGRCFTFPQCAFGTDTLKLTTLLCSPGLFEHFAPLSQLRCQHGSHSAAIGGKVGDDGSWNTANASDLHGPWNLT